MEAAAAKVLSVRVPTEMPTFNGAPGMKKLLSGFPRGCISLPFAKNCVQHICIVVSRVCAGRFTTNLPRGIAKADIISIYEIVFDDYCLKNTI